MFSWDFFLRKTIEAHPQTVHVLAGKNRVRNPVAAHHGSLVFCQSMRSHSLLGVPVARAGNFRGGAHILDWVVLIYKSKTYFFVRFFR